MGINGWELLAVLHHHDKLSDHKHCDCGDTMALICHVTSRDHMFMSGSLLRRVATLPSLVIFGLKQVEI